MIFPLLGKIVGELTGLPPPLLALPPGLPPNKLIIIFNSIND